MNDKQFQALLDKAVKSAVKSAVKHRQLMDQVGQECIERYGYHYSDLDIDCVIDAVDNGLGFISVDEIKNECVLTISFKLNINVLNLNNIVVN